MPLRKAGAGSAYSTEVHLRPLALQPVVQFGTRIPYDTDVRSVRSIFVHREPYTSNTSDQDIAWEVSDERAEPVLAEQQEDGAYKKRR